MKKTIKDYELVGKTVIMRMDFNVPMKDGIITDDNRIVESLDTIKYALSNGAKLILMSHLGKVKTEEDKIKRTLKPVADKLGEYLNLNIKFVPETKGTLLEEEVRKLQVGEVLLMENTRHQDFIDGVEVKKESKNDYELGAYWASLGDIFINDAFGTAHRAAASNVGIASHLPNGVGFLIEKELNEFNKVLENPERPYTVILGGAKVEDKINVIKNLVTKADHILIGGGMMFTFLKAKGYEIGKSLCQDEHIDFCKEMLEKYPNKILLPVDCICGKEFTETTNVRACLVEDIHEDEMGLDLSMQTMMLFEPIVRNSKTIVWNGPVGAFELKPFADGTRKTCNVLAELTKKGVTTIIGGGDTAAAAILFEGKEAYTHVSTGGGASLELLEGKELPGLAAIAEREYNKDRIKI